MLLAQQAAVGRARLVGGCGGAGHPHRVPGSGPTSSSTPVGAIWVCTVGGSPGTWVKVGASAPSSGRTVLPGDYPVSASATCPALSRETVNPVQRPAVVTFNGPLSWPAGTPVPYHRPGLGDACDRLADERWASTSFRFPAGPGCIGVTEAPRLGRRHFDHLRRLYGDRRAHPQILPNPPTTSRWQTGPPRCPLCNELREVNMTDEPIQPDPDEEPEPTPEPDEEPSHEGAEEEADEPEEGVVTEP